MFKQGDKVMANGYPGVVVRVVPMVGAYIGGVQPYEVRLPGGVVVQFEGGIGFYNI